MALRESRLEISRSTLAILVGFWDSFLVGLVLGRKSELVLSLRMFMEDIKCSRCLQYRRMRFLSVMCSSESE